MTERARPHPLALRDAISDHAASWLRDHLSAHAQLSSDSRSISPGDGFLARARNPSDAQAHVREAIAAGASAVLMDAGDAEKSTVDAKNQVPTLQVPGLAHRMGMVASAYYNRPSMRLALIAVTGTNGKSTVTAALAYALARSGVSCAVIGTLGCAVFPAHCETSFEPAWDCAPTRGLTTPDAVDLQRLLSQLEEKGVGSVAIEASSIGIEQGRLQGCAIKVAAFTNLSHDHLDVHASMQDYARAKSLLFESTSLGAVVVNTDDAYADLMWNAIVHPARRIAVGQHVPSNAELNLYATDIRPSADGWNFSLQSGGKATGLAGEIALPAHGRHNIDNALTVAGCLLAMKIDAREIRARLREFRLPPGRLQMITSDHGPLVCVDYAHSPQALARVLEALRPIADTRSGKLICIFGCGGDRDAGKRPLMGEVSARIADAVVLTSDNPRSESPQAIINDIEKGVPQGLTSRVATIVARDEAIARTIAGAQPSDLVLIAGKGHEQTQTIGTTVIAFDDVVCARAALSLRAKSSSQAGVAHA